ncbi:MAG: hypothetical protein AAF726_09970 [Planctomycetota bacterium]
MAVASSVTPDRYRGPNPDSPRAIRATGKRHIDLDAAIQIARREVLEREFEGTRFHLHVMDVESAEGEPVVVSFIHGRLEPRRPEDARDQA